MDARMDARTPRGGCNRFTDKCIRKCVPLRNSLLFSLCSCLFSPVPRSVRDSARSNPARRVFFAGDPRELVVIPVFREGCRIFSRTSPDDGTRYERERVLRSEILGTGEKSPAVFFVIARILSASSRRTRGGTRSRRA